MSINLLEAIVGEKLFTRKTRSVEITEAGKIFYDYAQLLLKL
ncbi:LysR family transcriptional regulator [Niallia sp. NCCP-28]